MEAVLRQETFDEVPGLGRKVRRRATCTGFDV